MNETNSNLTRSQFLMWMGQKLTPAAPLYNMVMAYTLHGKIDPQQFAHAYAALQDGADALRTVVAEVDTVPMQRVLAEPPSQLEFVDYSLETDPQLAADNFINRHGAYPFDLSQNLIRSALIKVADDRFIWTITLHHLITDAWTASLVFQRMANLYRLAGTVGVDGATPLPRYADYVEFECDQRDTPRMAKAQAYWRDKLAEPLEPTTFYGELPYQIGNQTQRVTVELTAERSKAIRQLISEKPFRTLTTDQSLYNIFTALMMLYLHRVSGKNIIRMGSPFHNRHSAEFKRTIGLFIEVAALEVSIDPADTFATLVKKVARETQKTMLNARPGTSSAVGNRAYDVLLNYVTANMDDFAGLPVTIDWKHAGYGDDHKLRVQVENFGRNQTFLLHFDFNIDVFTPDQQQLAIQHFFRFTDFVLSTPSANIGNLNFVDEASQFGQHLADFNQTQRDFPADKTVIDLFRAQVQQTPDRVAIQCGTESLTYAELDAKTDALAHELRQKRGSDPSTWLIGLCVHHSIEAVVGILSILKAGGAYVPIDPLYPVERIRNTVDDAGLTLLLTDEVTAETLPKIDNLEFFILHTPHLNPTTEIPLSGKVEPSRAPSADDAAYVIYTSGSTGKPKGVLLGHRSLTNYVCWARDAYTTPDASSFPLFSSLSFDLTVTSIYVPLISGGTVVVYPSDDNFAVLRVFADDVVDVVKLTPAHLALVNEANLEVKRIQRLILGGEDLKTDLVRQTLAKVGPHLEICNEYGPTEATVGCMIHRFDPIADIGASVPIGTPAANANIHVLDAYGHPTPEGVVGEMFIGGAGLAKGYWNRPELTADRFANNLYQTGDLARWLPNGQLQFLGRRDHQVKIRGARIELGEVEAAILGHPQISEAVVTVVDIARNSAEITECTRCGLPSTYPDVTFNSHNVCNLCTDYDQYRHKVDAYWGEEDQLEAIVANTKAVQTGDYDAIVLLSGGKDSTYMLYRLVGMGLRPLVFSLDNGYISDDAKANIRRCITDLGLDHHFAATEHMPAIFADSLARHSNVCHGCFKTIYTLSLNIAAEKGIRYLFTGLSRGQLFETRLTPELFKSDVVTFDQIDTYTVDARKAYHRLDDAIRTNLPTDIFETDDIFEQVKIVDFYRYVDVPLDEVYRFLGTRAPWVRPSDTGRSTNCVVNDVGIYIHKKETGYHNYALPYSWDVRLGHKERDAALEELDDSLNMTAIRRMLGEIGYDENSKAGRSEKRLAAYFVVDGELPTADLRQYLSQRLPNFMLPTYFVGLTQLPLTRNGKIDRAALPEPSAATSRTSWQTTADYVAPANDIEATLAEIWVKILQVDRVGVHDNFFELGGDSIMNIQIVARAGQAGLKLTPNQLFRFQTIAELALVAESVAPSTAEQGEVTGPLPLLPIQQRFFALGHAHNHHYNQTMLLDLASSPEPGERRAELLEQALNRVVSHHDALRLRFVNTPSGWQQTNLPSDGAMRLQLVDLNGLSLADAEATIAETEAAVQTSHDLGAGHLLSAALFDHGDRQQLLISIHHLAIDAVSWTPLLEDLATAYGQLSVGGTVQLPVKTASFKRVARSLERWVNSSEADVDKAFWLEQTPPSVMPKSGLNLEHSAETTTLHLTSDQTTKLLIQIANAFNANANDLLLTALLNASGGSDIWVDVEGHGRNLSLDLDVSRTVGWFTSLTPSHLKASDRFSAVDDLKAVKERLRTIPNHSFGPLRWWGDEATRTHLAKLRPQILFNYLGRLDEGGFATPFASPARELTLATSGSNRRGHLLEINAYVLNGQLMVKWTTNGVVPIGADHFMQTLVGLIGEWDSAETNFTPTDFPEADLDQDELDALLAEFGD